MNLIQCKANTYRLCPDAMRREALGRIAEACRMVYNLALEQRRYW
ncbi:helix-turn-helix domain-containing protein [Acetobacter sp. LMG 32666]